MSIFTIDSNRGTPMEAMVKALKANLNDGGSAFKNPTAAAAVASLESIDSTARQQLHMVSQDVADMVRGVLADLREDSSLDMGMEEFTDTQIAAGVMSALAFGDTAKYAQAALNPTARSADGVNMVSAESIGPAGSLDFRDEPAMGLEAFDETKLNEMMPYSIAFNIQAARQDEFSEAFYPTVVVSPDTGAVDITVEFTSVFNHVKRSGKGDATDFKQVNLLDARRDHTILEDEAIALVPYMKPDDSSDDKFVDKNIIAPYNVVISNNEVRTAPLAVGKKLDLIGISDHPGLIGEGVLDNTDSVHKAISIANLYLHTVADDNGTLVNEVFKFPVGGLPRTTFTPAPEGNGLEMVLNMNLNALNFTSATKTMSGAASIALADVTTNDLQVRLGVSASGTADLQFGTLQVTPTRLEVLEVLDADGNSVALSTGVGASIVAAVEAMKVIGYDIKASRTNTNRRTQGLLLNNNQETDRFAIPLGSPISAPSPTGSDRSTRDLESLVNTARIRNSNNAVTTLLNRAESLRLYAENRAKGLGKVNIEGIARHVVHPFFEEVTINMPDIMNSIRSKDRAEDISSTFVNAIRDLVYRAYRESGYQSALDASSTGSKKPSVIIGTDSVIQRHLMVEGDTRTLGVTFEDVQIVQTLDQRMKNKIVIAFTRKSAGGTVDALSFGAHAWIPELTSSMQVNRNGSMYREAMVQPRSRHVNNLPIMMVVNVEGLEDVMIGKTS